MTPRQREIYHKRALLLFVVFIVGFYYNLAKPNLLMASIEGLLAMWMYYQFVYGGNE